MDDVARKPIATKSAVDCSGMSAGKDETPAKPLPPLAA
jgi:hypothetical protein